MVATVATVATKARRELYLLAETRALSRTRFIYYTVALTKQLGQDKRSPDVDPHFGASAS